ncbi:hypothetical protein AQJ67_14475 [Streptomyces caeruleatus]|uniref:Uncharacterized protein n=1 Tax=Streptomyces caeruleatus TaxID=661399 RepID=A0A101U498_9ACTN|nr:hypothetical protein AQJ67_14475 [Streptomyces caeruleatus]
MGGGSGLIGVTGGDGGRRGGVQTYRTSGSRSSLPLSSVCSTATKSAALGEIDEPVADAAAAPVGGAR